MTSTDLSVDPASVIWAKDWPEVMSKLREFHPDGGRVAVYRDTAQHPARLAP